MNLSSQIRCTLCCFLVIFFSIVTDKFSQVGVALITPLDLVFEEASIFEMLPSVSSNQCKTKAHDPIRLSFASQPRKEC